MRSLDTRNFFATDFFSWSTLWLVSTVTEKLPPVVVLMFSVIWWPPALLITDDDDPDDVWVAVLWW